MNILQIGSYLYPEIPGGAEISAQNVATALTDAGHRIVRLRWRQSASKQFGGRLEQAEEGQWIGSTWRPYTPLETKPGLTKAVFYGLEFTSSFRKGDFARLREAEKINAVLVHSFRGMGYDLVRQVAALNLPTVMFLHDFALICLNKAMFRSGNACEGSCTTCRYVAHTNSRSLRDVRTLSFVGASGQLVEKTRAGLALDHAEYYRIPNPNRYNLDPRVRHAPATFTLGYVGRMEHDKGIVELLGVADELRASHGIKFILAGTGSLAPMITEFATTRPWVDYRGFVQPDKVVEVYKQMDILAVPSLWAENFPGVIVQALGNGVPSVGFDIGGTPEMIQDGLTGFVIKVGDFGAMRDAIRKMLDHPELFNNMSRASIEASQELAPDRLRARVVEAIEATIARADVPTRPHE